MPLVLMGARQVGKTFLLKEFGENEFNNTHIFDFQENPELSGIFQKDLEPFRILDELSVRQKKDIILFDEIQECDKALTSLKYFLEKIPELHIAAAGSLLGIKLSSSSFPVGKVDLLHLYPMNFEEFLIASIDKTSVKLFNEISRLISAHEILWNYLKQYFFTGGMPKAVLEWFSSGKINERIINTRKVQKDIITGYEKDFSKHSGKVNALHISSVLNNIPIQLSRILDGSVKRHQFKDVLPNRKTYSDLSGPISWLEHAGLICKVFNIEGMPRIPLKAFVKDNIFKLFLFDVGLLGAMLDLNYNDMIDQDYGLAKGFFAENYVACELKESGIDSLYSWTQNKSEIEFLYATKNSEIIPIEVKSGTRLQAKSLKSYADRYSPQRTIKLAGTHGNEDKKNMVLPLYYAGKLQQILEE